MTDDELDRLLTVATGDAAGKAAVLAASIRTLPKRGVSHANVAASILAALGFGIAGGWLAKPVPVVEPERIIVKEFVEVPTPLSAAPVAAKPKSLDKMEAEAELADAATAATLYRQIADQYLQRSDVASAARCYRLYLNQAGPEALQAVDGDSWLLISLKSSTRQENLR